MHKLVAKNHGLNVEEGPTATQNEQNPIGPAPAFRALASEGRIKPANNGAKYKLILNGVEEIKWFTERGDRFEREWKPQQSIMRYLF